MDQWGKERVRAKSVSQLKEGKVGKSYHYLELEVAMSLTCIQELRAREYVRLLVKGQLEDHYKLLSWICALIIRSNPDSRAFHEFDKLINLSLTSF